MVKIIDQEGRVRKHLNEFDCEICGNVFVGQWTDFHGQATCYTCGAPHQMKSYSGSPPDMEFPRIDLNKEFKPVFKEYWEATGKRCRIGSYMGYRDYPGVPDELDAFTDWMKNHHPEFLAEPQSSTGTTNLEEKT